MKQGLPALRDCWPLLWAGIVLCLMRLSWVAINPWMNFIAAALLALLVVVAMRTRLVSMALILAVLGPLLAWLLDVVDGRMSFVYGFAILAASIFLVKSAEAGLNPVARGLIAALIAALVVVLGATLIESFARERTPGAALWYAITRHFKELLAYCVGSLISLADR